jgi:hypothetical protein
MCSTTWTKLGEFSLDLNLTDELQVSQPRPVAYLLTPLFTLLEASQQLADAHSQVQLEIINLRGSAVRLQDWLIDTGALAKLVGHEPIELNEKVIRYYFHVLIGRTKQLLQVS